MKARSGFVGNRSVFPGLGPKTILLSDTHEGLFVVDATNVLPNSLDVADFNADGELAVVDIDLLTAEIVASLHAGIFDLNGDTLVDTKDLDDWLVLAGEANLGRPYQGGDANLDGQVDPSDPAFLDQLAHALRLSRAHFRGILADGIEQQG